MERVYGCDCSLALAEDGFNRVVPIPYVRETVREVSKGFWPPVSLSGLRSQYVNYSYGAEGCFITRLDSQCSKTVMGLIGLGGKDFNLVQDRTFIKKEYEHLKVREFSLYGENGKPFYFTAEVENGFGFECRQDNSIECPKWKAERTYQYDGHLIMCDGTVIPFAYRFELKGNCLGKMETVLYEALCKEFMPQTNKIGRIEIPLDMTNGEKLVLEDLLPLNDMSDIDCADSILEPFRWAVGKGMFVSGDYKIEF